MKMMIHFYSSFGEGDNRKGRAIHDPKDVPDDCTFLIGPQCTEGVRASTLVSFFRDLIGGSERS